MSIDLFFNPKSVAVIGASNKKGKVGYALMEQLKEFKGEVFPVNIKKKKINGQETKKSVLDLKEKIDLAIICTPAETVPGLLKECGEKGIKSVIIISAGFSESGNEELEKETLKMAREEEIRILGPNCFGVLNTKNKLNTTFAKSTPEGGRVAFVSQSGALWSAVADWSKRRVGFSKFISLGNMGDVGFNDLIGYLDKDKETKVIVLYIEYLKNGKEFMKACKKTKKPIVAIKVGKSKLGKEAAKSHTGALAGEYEIYEAAFKQSGVFLAEDLTNAFDMARFLEIYEKPERNKVVIVSNAGGPGALGTDFLTEAGLEVVKLPESFIENLDLPETWSKRNPIDLVGDAKAERYKKVFSKLRRENFFDVVLVILTPQYMTEVEETARVLADFKKKTGKVVISCFMGGKDVQKGVQILKENNIPNFFELKRVARVLKNISSQK